MNNDSNSCQGSAVEDSIRAKSLIFASMILAVLIEVFPTEAGMTSLLSANGLFFLWLLGKLFFLSVILLPLAIYIVMNGLRGLRSAWGQVTTVGTIVIVRIVLDMLSWSGGA